MGDEDEGSTRTVSALRAQIQEKLLATHNNGSKVNGSSHIPSSSISINIPNENTEPPPIPPHSPKRPQVPSADSKPPLPEKISRPPPPPPTHRNDATRRASATKPPIAPKPLLEFRKSSAPTIVVDSVVDQDNLQPDGTIRQRAEGLEKLGLKLRNSTASSNDTTGRSNGSNGRPVSTISSTSIQSEMTDSDSEDEGGRPSEFLRAVGLDILSGNGSGKLGLRRPSAVCFNGDTAMHEQIMNELKRQGVVRASSHHQGIYKKKTDSTQSPRTTRSMRENNTLESEPDKKDPSGESPIPQDIGKMRDDKKIRRTNVTNSAVSTETNGSDESREDESETNRSTTISDTDLGEVKDYDTGNPEEDKRLKKLHYAANEFYTVQKNFFQFLLNMQRVYPNYVAEFGRRLGKDLLAPPPGQKIHPVRQIEKEFSQLITFHEMLLNEFAPIYATWDSRDPKISQVILKYADVLKSCLPFLKIKDNLVKELLNIRKENQDFDNASTAKIFARGVGAVGQQLDQVHQNLMRYKILMISYMNYLAKDSEEYELATKATEKLETICQNVNEKMGYPSDKQLCELYDRFQSHFNVFVPGRRLLRCGEVKKQSRKDKQNRYLVLFSDVFWICRVASLSSGYFDLNRSYHLLTETVNANLSKSEDQDTYLHITSKHKSFTLIFATRAEATAWQDDLNRVHDERKRYIRRMSNINLKERRTSSTSALVYAEGEVLDEENNTLTPPAENEDSNMTMISRSHSLDSPGTSQPTTPVDEHPEPFGENLAPRRRIRRADREQPLWIPDEASSKCLMEGCTTVFSVFVRRHHCRDCGFLICSKCCGKAPVAKCEFRKENVCPECYTKIKQIYKDGDLFPERMLVKSSDNLWKVRIKKSKNSKNYEVVDPRTYFVEPQNVDLKRSQVEERIKNAEGKIFNEVFIRTSDGQEISRFAELSDELMLKFFKFRLDKEPIEQHVIHGFELKEEILDEGGTLFELIHRNQIRTSKTSEHVIAFRIQKNEVVKKWSAALQKAIGTATS